MSQSSLSSSRHESHYLIPSVERHAPSFERNPALLKRVCPIAIRNRTRRTGPRVPKPSVPQNTKEAPLEVFGSIKQVFPSTTFSVELDNGHVILAHIAGRLRRHRIKILPGDRVEIEVSPYDLTK